MCCVARLSGVHRASLCHHDDFSGHTIVFSTKQCSSSQRANEARATLS